jgi:hypothetical protein
MQAMFSNQACTDRCGPHLTPIVHDLLLCGVPLQGSLQDGVFAAYLPFTDELELSALPTEDDMQGCVHAARPARHGCSEQQPLGAQP